MRVCLGSCFGTRLGTVLAVMTALLATGCDQFGGPARLLLVERVTETGTTGQNPSNSIVDTIDYTDALQIERVSRQVNADSPTDLLIHWNGDQLDYYSFTRDEELLQYQVRSGSALQVSLVYDKDGFTSTIDVNGNVDGHTLSTSSTTTSGTFETSSTVEFGYIDFNGAIDGVTTHQTTTENGTETYSDLSEAITLNGQIPSEDQIRQQDSSGADIQTTFSYQYDSDDRLIGGSSDLYGKLTVDYNSDGAVSQTLFDFPDGTYRRTTYRYEDGRTRLMLWQMTDFPLSYLFDLQGHTDGIPRVFSSQLLVF